MNKVIVTTSWDDGHKLDIRLAALLKKYAVAGTFYIAPENREISPGLRLSNEEIKVLSKDFEIGSHTMTHPVLTDESNEECLKQIKDSKHYLESLLRKKVTAFCYPRGAYDKLISKQVEQAGYKYARTVQDYVFELSGSVYEAGTTIETHRLPIPRLMPSLWQLARFCRWRPLKIMKNLGWEQRAKTMFDEVKQNGGVFHLWGHSWAIEKEHGWDKVEAVLSYIHGHKDVEYLTNSELVKTKGRKP